MRTVKLALRHPGTTLLLAARAAGRRADGLRQVRQRRRVLPQGRARLRPGACPRARQPLARREGPRWSATVEERVLEVPGLKTVYARAGEQPRGSSEITEDTIGVIQFEFVDWQERAPGARDHGRDPRQDRGHSRHHGRGDGAARRPADRQAGAGPARPRSIRTCCPAAAKKVAAILAQRSDMRDVDDGLPLPGIDWKHRGRQGRGGEISARASTPSAPRVQLVTNGVKVTEYRPSDNDKAVDILVRFPKDRRSLDQIDELRIKTPAGHVPIGNFVDARAGAARRPHQPRRRQPRHHGHRRTSPRACRARRCSRRSPPSSPRPISAPA